MTVSLAKAPRATTSSDRAIEHFGSIDALTDLVFALEPLFTTIAQRQVLLDQGELPTSALLDRLVTLKGIRAEVRCMPEDPSHTRSGEVQSIWSDRNADGSWTTFAEVISDARSWYCGEVAVIY